MGDHRGDFDRLVEEDPQNKVVEPEVQVLDIEEDVVGEIIFFSRLYLVGLTF